MFIDMCFTIVVGVELCEELVALGARVERVEGHTEGVPKNTHMCGHMYGHVCMPHRLVGNLWRRLAEVLQIVALDTGMRIGML